MASFTYIPLSSDSRSIILATALMALSVACSGEPTRSDTDATSGAGLVVSRLAPETGELADDAFEVCLADGFFEKDAALAIPALPRPISVRAGSVQVIRWHSSGFAPSASLVVESSSDGGISWETRHRSLVGDKRSYWTVPDSITGQILLRVRACQLTSYISNQLIIGVESSAADYVWENVTMHGGFEPRDGAGGLVYQERMWLIGGWRRAFQGGFPKDCSNDVWNSADGFDWTKIKESSFRDEEFVPVKDWEGRHTAGYVVFDDAMWIVGGDANQGHYMTDVWKSYDGQEWTLENSGSPVPWGPRILHYTLAHNGMIWVMGGQTAPQVAPAPEAFYDDIWKSPDGRNWERVSPVGPHWEARGAIGGRAVFENRMWVLGGGRYSTPGDPVRKLYNDIWSSADGVTWTRHSEHAPWSERMYHDVVVFDGKLWVIAGWNKKNLTDVWYSDDGENWTELPDTPWSARHATTLFAHDDALWVVAGNNMESDVWVLRKR